ncbi:hypothetical protein ESCO_005493 [Escovopsis weberi]|uniref:Transcription factor domain-containing protein n=1 Tax=Escovopsis weberi TaxID=150374 RepID=A0A0M9VUY0_ESCWE|nr:hypothetical protein ESCO_005493 [Escovopsis weberi]
MIPGYDEPRTTMAMRSILSAVPDLGMCDSVSSSISWPEGLPSSASESAYSTPPSDQQMPRRTPSMEWTGQMPPFPASSSPVVPGAGFPLSFGFDTTPPQGYATLYGDAMGFALPGYENRTPMYESHVLDSAMRSLSPQLLVGQSPDPLATMTDRSMYSRSLSREPVDALGLLMAQDVMCVNVSREIRSAIPAYLEVYWDKAHSMSPFIHRPTFEDTSFTDPEHLDILQCAMAAMATQFLDHREHRDNGHQLHAFAWERSKMVINSMQASSLPLHLSACHSSQRWKYWVDLESRRRLLSACFLLDVHTMSYLEQPRVATLGLDYDAPETLPIPLSVSTAQLWDARSSREWSSTNHNTVIQATVGSTLLGRLSAADVAAIPPFDAALLQAAHVLRLPARGSPAELDLIDDASRVSVADCALVALFPCSPSAMTYFALHHTPLHTLLSVSGDSWVFNRKILRAHDFAAHKAQLRRWRDSGSAALAVTSATGALAVFLDVHAHTARGAAPERKEISDFWAVYACALVCWAFAHSGAARRARSRTASTSTRPAALRWIAEVAEMAPCTAQRMSESERADGSGAVGLARRYIERECLGGRNMLLGDALGVLRKLEEGDEYTYF